MKFLLYHIMPLLAIIFICLENIFVGDVYLIIAFVLILPYLLKNKLVIFQNKTLWSFFLCVLIGSIFNLAFTQNGIGGTLNFIVAIGVMLYAINNIRTIGYISVLLCAYTIFLVYNSIFNLGISVNDVYETIGQSKNYPGYLMVICCCVWGFSKYVRTQQLPLILPLFSTIIAFFLDGRSSLGVLAIFSLFCVFFKFRRYTIISVIIGIVAIYLMWDELVYFYSFSNLSESGLGTSRYKIWGAYLNALDPISFTFGLDTLSVPLLREYGGNPHNAFLNYHYRMGILGLGALVYVILKALKILKRNKHYILLCFEILLLMRLFFDACIGGRLDFMIFLMFFYPILNESTLKYQNKNSPYEGCKNNNHKPIAKCVSSLLAFIEKFI